MNYLCHDGSLRSFAAILTACHSQESSHRFESYMKANPSMEESFTKRMSVDWASLNLAWHSQTHNSVCKCISFTYRSGVESVHGDFRRIKSIPASRSLVSGVGRALCDDSLKSAKEPLFQTTKIVVTDVDWLLGDMTNSTARHLCRLVCWLPAGCHAAASLVPYSDWLCAYSTASVDAAPRNEPPTERPRRFLIPVLYWCSITMNYKKVSHTNRFNCN